MESGRRVCSLDSAVPLSGGCPRALPGNQAAHEGWLAQDEGPAERDGRLGCDPAGVAQETSWSTMRRTSFGMNGFSMTGRPLCDTNSRDADASVSPVTK